MFILHIIAEEMACKKLKADHAHVLKEYDVDLMPWGVERLQELIDAYRQRKDALA